MRLRGFLRSIRRNAAAAGLLAGVLALASVQGQEADESNEPRESDEIDIEYDEQLIEEIIVRGGEWRQPEIEEPDWRRVEPTVKPPPRVRMSLGYDAEQERELRYNSTFQDITRRTTEPATVIRFRF